VSARSDLVQDDSREGAGVDGLEVQKRIVSVRHKIRIDGSRDVNVGPPIADENRLLYLHSLSVPGPMRNAEKTQSSDI